MIQQITLFNGFMIRRGTRPEAGQVVKQISDRGSLSQFPKVESKTSGKAGGLMVSPSKGLRVTILLK